MVKTRKCCLVSALPGVTYFKPIGIPLKFLTEAKLSVEEAEALRLKELQGLEQAAAAGRMGISRPTFQRVLASARKKVASAILNGKTIHIEGGNFQVTGLHFSCPQGHEWLKALGAEGDYSICPFCGEGGAPVTRPDDSNKEDGT